MKYLLGCLVLLAGCSNGPVNTDNCATMYKDVTGHCRILPLEPFTPPRKRGI